jgi:hypothetical protein
MSCCLGTDNTDTSRSELMASGLADKKYFYFVMENFVEHLSLTEADLQCTLQGARLTQHYAYDNYIHVSISGNSWTELKNAHWSSLRD